MFNRIVFFKFLDRSELVQLRGKIYFTKNTMCTGADPIILDSKTFQDINSSLDHSSINGQRVNLIHKQTSKLLTLPKSL